MGVSCSEPRRVIVIQHMSTRPAHARASSTCGRYCIGADRMWRLGGWLGWLSIPYSLQQARGRENAPDPP